MRSIWLAVILELAVPAVAAPKDDILAADRAFSAMSVAQGRHHAFLSYMTDDARLYQGQHPPILGKEAARIFFAAEEKADPAYATQKLEWRPLEAETSSDGSLGFTRGTWTYTERKADGAPSTSTGYYVTEWRKQPDGQYKFCLDIGGADKH